ncbi:MAG TPA: hypothetical protein PLA54_03405 [Spirochaetota bacterium]|nr:hypothetical protein [Spirochaetota bacterium]HQE58222.1 hypothetical protein [Spirochaetota bacterium]
MKKMIFAVSTLFLFTACGSDKTELSIKNSDQSTDSIRDIVWADGDASWGTEVVNENMVSSSKEVNETTGRIECTVDDGTGNYVNATVITSETGTETASIDEGSSNVVTVTASN